MLMWWILNMKVFCSVRLFWFQHMLLDVFRSLVWNVYSKIDSSFALNIYVPILYWYHMNIYHTYIHILHVSQGDTLKHIFPAWKNGGPVELDLTLLELLSRYLYTFSSQPWRYKLARSHWTWRVEGLGCPVVGRRKLRLMDDITPTQGNPKPSFLGGYKPYIGGHKNLHFSWFWVPLGSMDYNPKPIYK